MSRNVLQKITLFHTISQIIEGSPFIYKGTNPDVDSYSAFWDNFKLSQTALITELESKGVTDCYVCGLAYDVCVGKCGERVVMEYAIAYIN